VGKILAVGGALVSVPLGIVALVLVAASAMIPSSSAGCAPAGVDGTGPFAVSIMGPPSLTAAQLATWYRASGYADTMATIGTPVETVAGLYVLYGTAEGVRPEVAFVQAVVETGGFTNRDSKLLNNFAGIGHCDSCGQGMSFPSVAVGVQAQVQLLKRVVFGNDVPLAGADVAPTWGGRQASTLAGLAQNWASSPTYAVVLSATLVSLMASAGVALAPGSGGAGCATGGAVLPVPHDAVAASAWLTSPHHDYPAVDIPVPAGTEVYAPVSGTVTAAPTGGKCGLGVSIKDDKGDVFVLCHGADGGEIVKPGDKVTAGQLVMHSGYTGHVIPAGPAGAHLHVGINVPDVGAVCPQTWLLALWEGKPAPALASLPTSGCTS